MATVGDNVARFRELRGFTTAELARLADWDRPNLQRLQENKGGWSEDSLRRLAEALDVTAAQLIDDHGWRYALPAEFIAVPLMTLRDVSRWIAHPNDPSFLEGEMIITGKERQQRLFAVWVADDANLPTYKQGDVVICDADLQPAPGDMVVCRCGAFECLRQYRQVDEASNAQGYALHPLNQVYAAYFGIHSQTQVLGTVVESRWYRPDSGKK